MSTLSPCWVPLISPTRVAIGVAKYHQRRVNVSSARYQLRRVRRAIVRQRRDMRKSVHAPLHPEVLARYLAGTAIRWSITGMWAYNEFAGCQLREPHDLDVQIAREDVSGILDAMPSWQHFYVDCGAWFRWRGQPLADGIQRLVSRPNRREPWGVDWLLTIIDGDEWVYRYDARVRTLFRDAKGFNDSPIPFTPPEVGMLYKSRQLREKDTADFSAFLPYLDDARRAWLADAIVLSDPQHPWLPQLRS